jgi:hypothetical protein
MRVTRFRTGETHRERDGHRSEREWEVVHRWTTGNATFVRLVLVHTTDTRGVQRFFQCTRRVVVRNRRETVLATTWLGGHLTA